MQLFSMKLKSIFIYSWYNVFCYYIFATPRQQPDKESVHELSGIVIASWPG